MAADNVAPRHHENLPKCPTGIAGLDEVTGGGLPRGRPILVYGGAGCGKTLLAVEFLARGAMQYDEPGVFMAFEENADELAQNARSLGFDLKALTETQKLAVDYVHVERSEIEETGEYDLEGLFVRLGDAIDTLGAKRVVLDTIEVLFSGLSNVGILRSELRRLFRWLKAKGVTAIITGERGEGMTTRYGLEEYVSDCVIALDHRVSEQISTRRLRIVKYRGSAHGTNEFPFLIDDDGIHVVPITSAGMDHPAGRDRISTGIPALDSLLAGHGYYRGSSVLISGTAGSGKTSLASHFASAACSHGERCLFFSFEEAQAQLVRNMRSIGIDLGQWVERGLLNVVAARPTRYGLEMHLALMQKLATQFEPRVVVIDPISNFTTAGTMSEAATMLVRLVDFLKSRGATALFTSLDHADQSPETDVAISSIIDTWIVLRDRELGGEREGSLCVLKSRGMAHSRQVHKFRLTDRGVEIDASGGRAPTRAAARRARRRRTIAASQRIPPSNSRRKGRK